MKSGRGRKSLSKDKKKSMKIILYLRESEYSSIIENKKDSDEFDSQIVKRLLNKAYNFNISIE